MWYNTKQEDSLIMSQTKSNSITSILVSELNNNSDFRVEMLKLFYKKVKNCRKKSDYQKKTLEIIKKIIAKEKAEENNAIVFYDCTHSSLHYKEMNGTQIDIIARIPDQHKPVMMIEVKARFDEELGNSQAQGGTYQKTSETHGIPLVYIIPQNYKEIKKLPQKPLSEKSLSLGQIIITWEKVQEKSRKEFSEIINEYVEISYGRNNLQLNEKKDEKIINKAMKVIKNALNHINEKNLSKQKDHWCIGYFYSIKGKGDFFIGFTPKYFDNEKFFSLCIAEGYKNTTLGDRAENPLIFNDGWYYLPIPITSEKYDYEEDKKLIDTDVIKSIQEKIKDLNIEKIRKICKESITKNK